MRFSGIYSVVIILLFAQNYLIGQEHSRVREKINLVVSQYYQNNQFNGVVLVSAKGKIIYQKGFGFANMKQKIKNKQSTNFLIGSATKSFTAIAVLQCYEKNLLDLHTPVITYLPELNEEVGQLTLHQLMKNSSGLPVHLNRITNLEYRDISSEELIRLYSKIALSFQPGTKYEYSNLNYQLCALVVERVSGLSYPDFLKRYIFSPAGMNNSGVGRTYNGIVNEATGYIIENEQLIPASKNHLAFAMGAGDIYSNVTDLLKWDQALYGEKLLTKKSLELLYKGLPDTFGGYGYGFKIKKYNRPDQKTGKLVRHGGSMYGFICNIHRYLDDQILIVLLGNMRPYPVMEITNKIEKVIICKQENNNR